MQDPQKQAFAQIEAELTKQNAEWEATREQLLALGDVEVSIDTETLNDLEDASHPKLSGSLPIGSMRA